MNIKEQESQLAFKLRFEIVLTLFVWLFVGSLVGYRLFVKSQAHPPGLSIMNNVPSIKQSNIDLLRDSLKPVNPVSLPILRLEPFD